MTMHDSAVNYFVCKHGMLLTKARTQKYTLLVGAINQKNCHIFVGKHGAIHINRNNSNITAAISVTHIYTPLIKAWGESCTM